MTNNQLQVVLKALKTAKSSNRRLPEWAILEMAKHFGVVDQSFESLPPRIETWNRIIYMLDQHHPGWRGYTVVYKNGAIG